MPARLTMLVALSLLTACAQESWESYNDAGLEAKEQARYAEAEELLLGALREAEKFEEQAPRLATSLNNLALLYLPSFCTKYPRIVKNMALTKEETSQP